MLPYNFLHEGSGSVLTLTGMVLYRYSSKWGSMGFYGVKMIFGLIRVYWIGFYLV